MSVSLKQIKLLLHPSTLKKNYYHFALRGSNVKCACCGSQYITFLPAGIEKRANAKCIKCGSLERHRALWLFLRERGDLFNTPKKLLHIAPEKIFYDHFITKPHLDYHPVDLMPDKYAYGNKTKEMDVTDLKYPDNYFDAVMCNHVLEHIRNDQKAMSEMFRVLKPGGWAILNTPVDLKRDTTFEDINLYNEQKQLELFGQPDHVRIYGKDFLTRLEAAGFTNEVIDYVSTFSKNEQFRLGLKTADVIFYSTKP